MYSSTKSSPAYFPSPPAPASVNYPFLAKPPKHKHKPQPITVRCVPPRSIPRPTSSRRRASVSGSPAIQTSFIALVETPTPTSDTPKTPHLTTHGYAAAFSTLYQRRGSLPETPRSARRSPNSPKRGFPTKSAPSSPKRATGPGSPKRRTYRVPSPTSPFAPPSPTRPQTRPRAKSTTRIPAPAPAHTLAPPPRTPKLSKIRSFTNLRSRTPSPAPPPRVTSPMSSATSTPKQTAKRSKRSATPAHGSSAYIKYRPLPFIQQMQMVQFLEGGTLESHIRRHHVHAGQGTAHTGFAVGQDNDIAHGYAFTDERGMIWFDEEEEWEFACLLPRARRQPRRGIKRLLGKRREEESEDEWEEFAEEGAEQDEVVDPDVLLAREDDDLLAGQDDLAAFGGALDGAWGRDRPERSVLKLPEPKRERKSKRQRVRRASASKVTASSLAPPPAPTTVLKQEYLASAFVPLPTRSSPSPSLPAALPAIRTTSPFRMFAGKAHHRHARSMSNVTLNAPANLGEGQSFSSLGTSLRGGSVLDADVPPSPSPSVQWATLAPLCDGPVSRQPSPAPVDPRLRSVSPPPAAARRLGIDPAATVSLQPAPMKKPSFMSLRGFKSTR